MSFSKGTGKRGLGMRKRPFECISRSWKRPKRVTYSAGDSPPSTASGTVELGSIVASMSTSSSASGGGAEGEDDGEREGESPAPAAGAAWAEAPPVRFPSRVREAVPGCV